MLLLIISAVAVTLAAAALALHHYAHHRRLAQLQAHTQLRRRRIDREQHLAELRIQQAMQTHLTQLFEAARERP